MVLNMLKKIFGIRDNTIEIVQKNGYGSYEPFVMPVDEVVSIPSAGIVVTGKIESGTVKIGDKIKIIGPKGVRISRVVRMVKMAEKNVRQAQAGEAVGIVFKDINELDVQKGSVLEGLN